jgi:hypothetical protein
LTLEQISRKVLFGIGVFFIILTVGLLQPITSITPGGLLFSQLNRTQSVTLESPFKNTLAMIRWNSVYPERIPLIQKYTPFFHTLHFSMPNLIPPPLPDTYHNLTHDSWAESILIYSQVAQTMQLILDTSSSTPSPIQGLMFFHFDAWLDPLDFADENFSKIWFPSAIDHGFPSGPAFLCMTDQAKYPWWGFAHGYQAAAISAQQIITHYGFNYTVNPLEFCIGWSDIYYIPRRYFADYIFLSSIFAGFGVFHEIAVPTILHIIDQSRREHRSRSVIYRLGDCWGDCCASGPDVADVRWNRCGHRLDYMNEPVIDAFYGMLDVKAEWLGEVIDRESGRVDLNAWEKKPKIGNETLAEIESKKLEDEKAVAKELEAGGYIGN